MSKAKEALQVISERFGKDTLISVATTEAETPFVRIVNAYYEDGAFYVVTYALSNKMKQIKRNPNVAICGEWFTAHGIGENLGHVLTDKNAVMMAKLREVFATWYSNGHTNESDPNTCLLRIKLTDGVLFNNGVKYKVKFREDQQ
ncbi:MAG: pyridoxamine 5'-phosphate oxidase family protein [Eubacteriales bacterium]|nr:pyridoxamine 5'-phosphate oxidase family protein [Eubacteriales bacterium]